MRSRQRHGGQRRLTAVVRGLASSLLLVALVVGIPAVLCVMVGWPLPHGVPTWSGFSQAIADAAIPDRFWIGAVAVVGWLAWAQVAASVLAEVAATAMHRPTPQLPLVAAPARHLARRLVSSAALVGMLITPRVAMAQTSAPTSAVTQVVRAPVAGQAAPAPSSAVAQPAVQSAPVYVVGTWAASRECLWTIAERHLGDPLRWREIYQINQGRPQPDGAALADPDLILPGWHLELPADAIDIPALATPPASVVPTTPTAAPVAPAPVAPAPVPSSAPSTTVARPATTLPATTAPSTTASPRASSTSSSTPGSSSSTSTTKAPAAASAGVLPLPAAPGPGAGPVAPPSTTAAPPRTSPSAPGGAPLPAAPASGGLNVPTTKPSRLSTTSSIRAEDQAVPAPATDHAAVLASHRSASHAPVYGLLATGAVAVLEALRRAQRRRRQPGERIAMPEPELAEVEQHLRSRAEPDDAEALDIALRRLGAALRDDEIEIPEILGVQLGRAEVEIILGTAAAPAPAGFRLREGGRRWVCSRRGLGEYAESAQRKPAPLPALVTLGRNERGLLLANLEAGGLISVVGDEGTAREVLAAMALELATARWAEGVGVEVLGLGLKGPAGLPRLRVRDSPLGELDVAERAADVEGRCQEGGFGSTVEARVRAEGGAPAWAGPRVVMATAGADPSPVADKVCRSVVEGRGRCAQVVVAVGKLEGARWRLEVAPDGELVVPALRATVAAQRVGPGGAGPFLDLFEVAGQRPRAPRMPARASGPDGGPGPAAEGDADVDDDVDDDDMDGPGAQLGGEGPFVEKRFERELIVMGGGGVRVTGVSFARPIDLEVVAYLESRDWGADADQIATACWKGAVAPKTVHNTVSRARTALGEASDGSEFIPDVKGTPNHAYTVARRLLGADYRQFRELVDHAERQETTQGRVAALRAALEKVGGRPYDSQDAWAAPGRTKIQQEVVDAAVAMAGLCVEARDREGARFAIAKGRLVDPYAESEVLLCLEAELAHLEGDLGEVRTIRRRVVERLGADEILHPQTEALFSRLTRASG